MHLSLVLFLYCSLSEHFALCATSMALLNSSSIGKQIVFSLITATQILRDSSWISRLRLRSGGYAYILVQYLSCLCQKGNRWLLSAQRMTWHRPRSKLQSRHFPKTENPCCGASCSGDLSFRHTTRSNSKMPCAYAVKLCILFRAKHYLLNLLFRASNTKRPL